MRGFSKTELLQRLAINLAYFIFWSLALFISGGGSLNFSWHSVRDDKNKVGIRLFAKRKNGVFRALIGQRLYENFKFASDHAYKLEYTKTGKLKTKTQILY